MQFSSQMEAQRFLLRMVPKGYHWWLSGIENDKTALVNRNQKYAEFYGCDLAPAQKSYRKKKGLANTLFFSAALPPDQLDGGYIWFLIATDGLGQIRENSKLKDARTNPGRVVWGDYVMYEAPRHRLEGGGTRWSWYLKPDIQKQLDFYVGKLLKESPDQLKAFFEMQCKRPMHHGVRHFLNRIIKRAHQNFCKMYPGKKWIARDPTYPLPLITEFKSYPLQRPKGLGLMRLNQVGP